MKQYEDNPKSIKYHVKKYILRHQNRFEQKTVVDLPAGNGITSKILKDIGAKPLAFDLFPEYFQIEIVECRRANVMEGIPMDEKTADWVICQEGIEHFSNQFKALTEFNRVLKLNGSLIITTPNYSSLRSKLSYFLSESERFHSMMPPNELDSVWMNNQNISKEVYFGHVFLLGIHKLRVLARLAGFKIKEIQFTQLKTTSLLIFILTYPLIFLSNVYTYFKHIRKNKGYDKAFQKEVYKELFFLSINPKILLDSHLFVEFEKISDFDEVMNQLKSVNREFGTT